MSVDWMTLMAGESDNKLLDALGGARHWMAYAISEALLRHGMTIDEPSGYRQRLLDAQMEIIWLIDNSPPPVPR